MAKRKEIPLHRSGNTLFVPLPYALRRDIEGGCDCAHCKRCPNKAPQWDTLAIDAINPASTWTVHYPEIS
jgi:hypothetical protein